MAVVLSYGSLEEAEQIKDLYSLTLPFILDSDGALLEQLKPPSTPWKVLLRKRDGQFLVEEGRGMSRIEHLAFLEKARRLR